MFRSAGDPSVLERQGSNYEHPSERNRDAHHIHGHKFAHLHDGSHNPRDLSHHPRGRHHNPAQPTHLVFNNDIYPHGHGNRTHDVRAVGTDSYTSNAREAPNTGEQKPATFTGADYTKADYSKTGYSKEVLHDGTVAIRDSTGLRINLKGGSRQFQQQMIDEIGKLPEAQRKLLAGKGITYTIANKITDIDPTLANKTPEGWPAGKTFGDVSGMYMPEQRSVVLAERTRTGFNQAPKGVLLHESAHAIDAALGEFSHSAEFKKAYEKDVERLSSANRNRLPYLFVAGDKGREETYADVSASLRGSSSVPAETARVLATFPNVAALLRKRLAPEA